MRDAVTRIHALAWNSMRQAVRDKVLYVLAGFCGALIVGSVIVSQLTVGERVRIVTDLGLSAISILTSLTAVFVTVNQAAREIERRTIGTVLAKPVARWEFVAGRFAGIAATLAVTCLAMGLLQAAVLALIDGSAPGMGKAVLLSWLEAVLVAAVAVFLSTFMTTLPALFIALTAVVIGHTSHGLLLLASKVQGLPRHALNALYSVLPNLDLLNVRAQVVWGTPIPWSSVAWGAGYVAGYSTVLLVLAAALLERRDLA